MAMIDECLAGAVKIGTLSAKGVSEYAARMKDAEALAAQRGMAGQSAYTFALTEAAVVMEKKATSTRARVQQEILAIDRAWEGAKSNSKGVGFGLTAVFGERVAGKGETPSIGQMHMGNRAAMQRIMSDFLSQIQSRAFGLKQNLILPQHVVRELYGTKTSGPDAGNAAKAWDSAMEWWRDGMAQAGVFIRELKDWRLPQHFDSAAVRAIGKDGFTGKMEEWWKAGKLRLRDWDADGEAYFVPGLTGDIRVRDILEKAYVNITDGAIEPGAVRAHSMADRYNRRRAFEWATDDAWLEFNRTFGVGDDAIGELMVRHMDSMSRDLAAVQVLGPDPDRAAQTLIQMYKQQGGSSFWANKLNAIYEIGSGKATQPVSQRLALGAQAFRQFLASAQLGGAVLSAPSDFGFTKATAAWHGLEMSGIMRDYIANLAPSNPAHRAEAMRSGLILDVGLRGLHDASRDVIGDVVGRTGVGGKADAALNGMARVSGRMLEVVLRAQGLSHHTQSLRDALGSQMMAHLGDLSPRAWDALSGVDKRTFETYGMGQKDWDLLRTKGVTQGFLDPARMAVEGTAAERQAATKMLGAIAHIQRAGVPEGNVVTRAISLGASRPGTLIGEFMRGIAQYQGFPMAAFMTSYFRAMESLSDGHGQWFRGQYIASLVVSTTVLGAVSLQLKNIRDGKDPEPMWYPDDPVKTGRFWAYAAAQGGATGIIGNQLKAVFSAGLQADPARQLSPTAGFVADLGNLTLSNLGQDLAGRETNFGREAVRMANKYTPDVFYTRLAMDRLVWDTTQRMADPDYAGAFSRIEQRARKQQGTEYYWRPGSLSPRAPTLGRAVP